MKKHIFLTMASALSLLLGSFEGWAAEIPGRTNHHVNDYARIYSDKEVVAAMEAELAALQAQKPYSLELIVTTFESTEGMPLNQFLGRYVRKWRRPWPFERDRRMHILIFMDTGTIRLGIGRGVEHIITPQVSAQIVNDILVPHFKRGEYGTGTQNAIRMVVKKFTSK